MLTKGLYNARRSTQFMAATSQRTFFGTDDNVLSRSDRKAWRKLRLGPFVIVGEKYAVLCHRF
jgi:hypothetical protein